MMKTVKRKGVTPVKKRGKAMILLTAVMMLLFGLFGCTENRQFDIEAYRDAEKNTMLLDYFERTVGTPEEQPYYELVLYTCSDTQALLEEYADGGTDHETLASYLIPLEAAQEMLTAVKTSGMAGWERLKNPTALDGMQYVCKFPDGRGDYIRVTSDNMPEDGTRLFGGVKAAMRKWAKDEYLQE